MTPDWTEWIPADPPRAEASRVRALGLGSHTPAGHCYRGAMGDQQLWERVVGGHFVLAKRSFWPNFFSQLVARLHWNPMAIDLRAGRPRVA